MASTGSATASAALAGPQKHPLASPWTYWELRKKDARQGLAAWKDLPTALYSFDTVEDFWALWKHTPNILDVFYDGVQPPSKVEREDPDRKRTTEAQAYMIFRKGYRPETEFEIDGVRATKQRRRFEMSVRAKDFDTWWKVWEAVILAMIGESVDPSGVLLGAYLTDKHKPGSAALRLELWLATDDDELADAVSSELSAVMRAEVPDLANVRFAKVEKRK